MKKRSLGQTPVVTPLPVLIVATYDEGGTPNAMNVAWGGQCGFHEVALNLSPSHKTTANIRHKQAFTLSFATEETLVISDYFGLVSGNQVNKIESSGVTVTRSEHVDAPVLNDYPLTLECKVVSLREELGEVRVVGEVVNVLAEESILDARGRVDIGKLRAITFDSSANCYRVVGEEVGKAFKAGRAVEK